MSTTVTLYSVADELVTWLDTLDAAPQEQKEEVAREVVQAMGVAVRKVDSFCQFLAFLESQIDLAKAEEARLADRRRVLENRLERIKGYAVAVLESTGLKKLDGATSTLSLRAKPASVEILDREKLPAEFVTVKTEYIPDKKRIKSAIDAGRDVPGADLRFGGNYLVRR